MWTPFLEAADDGQEFFVLDIVVTFRRGVFLRVECHWVKDSGVVMFGVDTRGDVVGGVCLYDDRFFGVEVHQNWGRGEGFIE